MKHDLNIWVLGGDRRQAWLARQLAEDGHQVHTYALEQLPNFPFNLHSESTLEGLSSADAVILPLPAADHLGHLYAPLSSSRMSMCILLDALLPGQFICGGRIDDKTADLARSRGLVIQDYFLREELAVANCVPTAEGCVQLAMEHLPITIHGARVLIIGYGRVGLLTAHRFSALGAHVTVAARRREQQTRAESFGMSALHIALLAEQLGNFDLVVNTVPAALLKEAELSALSPECPVIDLASQPGGDGVSFGSGFIFPLTFGLYGL